MSLRIFSKPAIVVLILASVGTVMYRKLYQDRCSRTLGTWPWRLIGQMATSTVPKHKNLPVSTWAPTEKKLARIAFDKAFERQCTAISQEAKRMLETTTVPSDIFRVQEYLTEQRRIVDRLYDYRYSRLLEVFGRLLSDGWVRESDLNGLQPEKITKIKHAASFYSQQ